ncbi:MAG: UDP-N-acetylglucosamine diphosphorylase/glucosamine-1-phosphate N-acetyltransferase [Gammaproteobacteria bacterium]|nr:UDP-N-acetylglucosamine diphosphorylase/glucosamine-1-phosphate N-acetyltransferase [Gammaproteobacteria bacterium]
MNLGVVILAAGKGTRMKSHLPKVLHRVAHKPLVSHVIDTARALDAHAVAIVYGHGGEQVPETIGSSNLQWVEQAEQLGTGHAVEQALPAMADCDRVLVLYGDVPLISTQTLQTLIDAASDTSLALLTLALDDPSGYGRIVRDQSGRVLAIVEQKDATSEQLAINEINTGILIADRKNLEGWLARLESNNAQGEFYLTDIVAMAVADGVSVHSAQPVDEYEVLGVNDRVQLATLERYFQQQQADRLMRAGVTLMDPARFDLRGELESGQDVIIDVNVVFEGRVVLGNEVEIGPNVVIRDSEIGDGVKIQANCVIESARVGSRSRIGPFARLRPDAILAEQVHVGNFVEIKKSDVAEGSKINHLSYVGDSTIGSGVNVGAGVITCNYDGAYKHRTVIGDDAFIGSDCQLVAPVTIGAGATIGAGSTITKDTPEETLTLSRARQVSLKGYNRPRKESK